MIDAVSAIQESSLPAARKQAITEWMQELPVTALLADVEAKLTTGRVVLEAPPGAGKSTALPLSLLFSELLAGQRIIMLQPRRVAALSIANYLAQQLGEQVGQTVGYHIRGNRNYHTNTRLLIVTEGIFTRMIQADPELAGIGLVIFDEFHERHLHSDLGLATALEATGLNPQLRLLIMSATIPAQVIANWLGDAAVLSSAGRQYPVQIEYRPAARQQTWQQALPGVVTEALQNARAGVLVFLPGVKEIRQLAQSLQLPADITLYELHGQVSLQAQQQAVGANPNQGRKLVLATNIAETSLTLSGIDVVVDSGRVRQAHFYPQHGITRLLTRRISRAAAEQRAGRAGRTSAGRCYRVWAASDQHGLADYAPAEIATQDLSQLLLECKIWGAEPQQMQFLTPPNAAHLTVGAELLESLGVLNSNGAVTAKGQQVVEFSGDARLACMALWAQQQGPEVCAEAALVAAVLENPPQQSEIDLQTLLEQTLSAVQTKGRLPEGLPNNWQQRLRWWQQRLANADLPTGFQHLAELLLWAYPDRIAARRSGDQRYKLAYGGGAVLPDNAVGSMPELLVVPVLTLQENAADAVIRWAVPITAEQLQHPQVQLKRELLAQWGGPQQRLQQVEVERVGALILSQREQPGSISADQRLQALIDYVRNHGLQVLAMNTKTEQLLARLAYLYEHLPAAQQGHWPDFSEGSLLLELDAWASGYWQSITSLKQLGQWSPEKALLARLSYAQQQELERQCPPAWQAPSGRQVSIDYTAEQPTVAVKLQEAFGEPVSPKIVYDKVILTLDLLSPAGRLLQRTRDLASFWQNAYQDVKKEMKGRYPKHPWPDDPSTAQATAKTKRQLGA
ncbi:ATP-dependent helicase HrpB [Pseudidiomarina planktonica]|uniref:ATP-dependent helicase HrpB n=1 Tax=Pseudidiomarina planktonica TaxID=1323738 RepID=A0A1Y6G1W4_9GAMM|nr:ATP-dependent helicase HrpB [Pseudidiomarina planktonica]RUO63451.1 ATP-dependent helicase HrpB [Pseudidiomarina planktonica]SMQ80302.1 ATP-dependent helicase HrpB [Pseudidiomarina planktonica]